MKPIDQTIFVSEGVKGNCLQAAIASLLELPLESVPHFVKEGDWLENIMVFLDRHNLRFYEIPADWSPNFYHLVLGMTERGFGHIVIKKGMRMVHDPHPSRSGLTDVLNKYILVPKTLAVREAP